jgi:hypothetical protein
MEKNSDVTPEEKFKGEVELTDKKINLYKSAAGTTPDYDFALTDVYYLDEHSIFNTPYLKKTTKNHLIEKVKEYENKLSTIQNLETKDVYESSCLVLFIQKNVPPQVNGSIKKENGLAFCFQKVPNDVLVGAFYNLFVKKFVTAMETETDLYKIQLVPPLHNMDMIYYSPYLLYKTPPITKITTTYANLNEHGVSYNDQDVFKFLILGF